MKVKTGYVVVSVLLALLAGCGSPGTIRMDMLSAEVEATGKKEVGPRFVTVPTLATVETGDWDKVQNLANLTGITDHRIHVSRAAVSPTQDAMVFFQLQGKTSIIYRQSLSSQARSPITSSENLDLSPSFTPDGEYLVFSSDRTGEGQGLWRIRSDGAGGVTQITSSPSSFDVRPSVAVDGETVVFQAHRSTNLAASIWSVNMNGGLLTQLGGGASPAVSPDGRRIAFVKPKPGEELQQIWVMNIDGSGLTQLTNNGANNMDPSWHPNGRLIVFASDQAEKEKGRRDYDIWMMRADGTQPVQLTSNPSRDDAPTFDRQGRQLIFRSNRGGAWNLFSFQPALR